MYRLFILIRNVTGNIKVTCLLLLRISSPPFSLSDPLPFDVPEQKHDCRPGLVCVLHCAFCNHDFETSLRYPTFSLANRDVIGTSVVIHIVVGCCSMCLQ